MKGMKYLLILSVFMVIPFAYAEEYYVSIGESGFTPTMVDLNEGDTLKVVGQSDITYEITDPYTQESITFNGIRGVTFNMDLCSDFSEFDSAIINDRSFNTQPLLVNTYCDDDVAVSDDEFTGWKQEGNTMVAYRLGQEITSYEIGALPTETRPAPSIDTDAFNFSDDAGILSLRLQILQVFESILAIVFGR